MTMSMFQQASHLNILGAGDNSDYRNFVAGYRAALSGAGFIRTNDTGQIDPVTVIKPIASGNGGYEIWRFADAAQATQPLFFKLEYGFTSTLGRLNLYITIGTGSDGAGNITGIRFGRVTGSSSGSANSTLADIWVSGGEGYLASGIFVHSANTASISQGWVIERFRLPDGTVDTSSLGAGFVFGGSTYGWFATSYDGVVNEISANWPGFGGYSSNLYRGATYAYPYYPILGPVRSACRSAVVVNPVDTGYSTPFTVALYGAPHVFRAFAAGSTNYSRGSNCSAALRYE